MWTACYHQLKQVNADETLKAAVARFLGDSIQEQNLSAPACTNVHEDGDRGVRLVWRNSPQQWLSVVVWPDGAVDIFGQTDSGIPAGSSDGSKILDQSFRDLTEASPEIVRLISQVVSE
jgi:hypothetical protein